MFWGQRWGQDMDGRVMGQTCMAQPEGWRWVVVAMGPLEWSGSNAGCWRLGCGLVVTRTPLEMH